MKSIDEYARELSNSPYIESSNSPGVPESKEIIIGIRKNCEKEVKDRIDNDLSDLTLHDWAELVDVMNINGFEKGKRFSPKFSLNNYHNLIKKKGPSVVNAAVEHLLRRDIDVVERVKRFQGTIGTNGPGLFSYILYINEPGTYFPWVGAINNEVNEFGLCSPPLKMGSAEDYPRYCEVMSEVMKKHGLEPQEMDYLFTTAISKH